MSELSETERYDGVPARRRRRREGPTRRVAALVAVGLGVAGVVAAGATVDRRGETDMATTGLPGLGDGSPTPAALSPVAPSADAAGSTWYCAAGSAVAGGFADHALTVANLGDEAVSVDITVFGGSDDASADVSAPDAPSTFEVPARGSIDVRLGDVVDDAPFVAALVEAGPGEVVVEHSISGQGEFDVAPCATSPSASWHVAAGATTRDARELLALFNPFPDDVVVDITFTTPEGVRSPPELEGFVIAGQRVVVVDVGAIVSRHPQVSTSIVARSGRLVVERIQTFDGTDGRPPGLALTPAAPAPALVWNLPDGRYVDGISETVTVYNPTDSTAEVDVEVTLAPSDDPTLAIGVEPFRLSIAPHAYAQVDLGAEPDRVPPDLGHATTVRSQNGVPVVAERWVRSGSPATTTGLAATLGSPVNSTRWILAIGGTTSGVSEHLVVLNPSVDTIARITITAPTPTQVLDIEGLSDVEIPSSGRMAIDLGAHTNREDLVLVIESTHPVIVERGLFLVSGGFALSIAVPSGEHASVPEVDAGEVTVP